ncbi:MAG: tetratricopeptide repeat protein [Planctomycetota bacterium]
MKTFRVLLLSCLVSCASSDEAEQNPGATWKQSNSTLHEKLADAALRRGDIDGALANSREALRVDPDRPAALMLQARALLLSGSSEEAERTVRRALQLRPGWADAWLVLAESLLDQNREGDARQAYWEAASVGSADAALVLGALELKDGAETTAVSLLSEGEYGGDVARLELLASHYWSTGRSDQAEEVLLRALQVSPGNPDLLRKLNQIQFCRGEQSQFTDRMRALERIGRPPTEEDRLLLAAGLLQAGEGSKASKQYREFSAAYPEDAELRLALGEALLLEGDCEGAESAFRAAERTGRSVRSALVGVARARLAAGKPGRALAPLAQALELEPTHVPTRSLLVLASVACGDLARAQAEAEEVRLLEPGGSLDHACRRLLERRRHVKADAPDE